MTDHELAAATEASHALDYAIDKLHEAGLDILRSKLMAIQRTLDGIRLASFEKRAEEE